MISMKREDLLERLKRIDEDAGLIYGEEKRFRMVIVGGGALILQQYISRATHDIDALEVSKELYELLEKYDINSLVQAYMNNFPLNYQDRIITLFAGKTIDFYTASLEDIVIAKLYSYRDTDRKDIESQEILKSLDWALLEHLAKNDNEAHANALNERNYKEFRENYEDYVKEFGPCSH